MIDQFVIFERGGTILWSRNYDRIKGDPLLVLVRSVLLEDRLSLSEMSVQNYTMKWTLDNPRGLFFVVLYQKQLPPPYANDLLQLVKNHFTKTEIPNPSEFDPSMDFSQFSTTFNNLLTTAEQRCSSSFSYMSTSTNSNLSSSSTTSAPSKNQTSVQRSKGGKNKKKQNSSSSTTDTATDDSLTEEQLAKNREAFLKKRTKGSKKSSNAVSELPADTATTAPTNGTKTRKKKMRPGNKAVEEDLSALDFSEGKPPDAEQLVQEETQRFKEQYLEADRNEAFDDILESDDDDDEDDDDADDDDDDDVGEDNGTQSKSTSNRFVNYFKGLAGMRSLTEEDLKPVMEKFRDDLVSKNVAKNIADKLIQSVSATLEGRTMESMTSISTMVKRSLEDALTRILTPRQSTDLLAEIAAKKAASGSKRDDPYVITFCGVNGVGKSTSLAKTCFYLRNHGLRVMIAACDTFRAGAVEQLRTHVRCLGSGVELFDRGYGKDAAAVAADAIRKAKELAMDVVLVDTAGRMQDNEPLMRALAKLVDVNKPDRVLFVGEALVGNDAVDQLTKFNQALIDYQVGASARLIDGIVLTKFDTIDDKVGAAVSMVYTTGQPIVFIGIGQTYMDLRKLNTKSLVKALLKL